MAQNGGSNGVRLPSFLGKALALKFHDIRRDMVYTIPAKGATPAQEVKRDLTSAMVYEFLDIDTKAARVERRGTTLIGYFSTIDAKVVAANPECVVGTLIQRPVAAAVEAGQFTYDLEPLGEAEFARAEALLKAAGIE